MLSKELEEIIEAALVDGTLTEKERAVLHKRAQNEGVDPDELDIIIDARLAKIKKSEDWLRPTPPPNLTNVKHGNVEKCPSCGAQVIGGNAICPECGYTFSNVQANSSVEKLLTKLEGVKGRKRKMEIISNFPVPNTRADLLEFLTMIQAKVDSTGRRDGGSDYNVDLSYAYWLLYTNCINKAKLSFLKDNDFSPYFEHYEKELAKTKGIIGYLRCNPETRSGIFLVIVNIVIIWLLWLFGKWIYNLFC